MADDLVMLVWGDQSRVSFLLELWNQGSKVTITIRDIEEFRLMYETANRTLNALVNEPVDENDVAALAMHKERLAEAREFRSLAHYAWDRAVVLHQQQRKS